ncbi:MAG: hypothetical protein KGI84_07145, partial [Elusimicrobia bacterium]|nr:hypothetical protein [Elusimicrobiota bacterium]
MNDPAPTDFYAVRRFAQRALMGLIFVFAYGILGSLLLGGGFHPAIQDPYTAIYFTVVTLS